VNMALSRQIEGGFLSFGFSLEITSLDIQSSGAFRRHTL
jgi:hypothetical protein